MEAQSHNEESLLLATGGFSDASYLSSVEVYPSTSSCLLGICSSSCSPPALPHWRLDHAMFLTSEPNPVIATCGGRHTTTCLVLNKSSQRWDNSMMGNLTMPRRAAAVVSLNFVGVFIIGGWETNNKRTSDFLAAGQMQWQEGPAVPVDMTKGCAVTRATLIVARAPHLN